jgi:hypothetical protein
MTHCEESQGDEAIQDFWYQFLDCFAILAMTTGVSHMDSERL